MSTYYFALWYEYLMGTWWEHIGNFKNPKDPNILPWFPQGKEKKEKRKTKTGPFGCLLPCLMG